MISPKTATTSGACACCGSVPIYVRTRSCQAGYIGFGDFIGTPHAFYRTKTADGGTLIGCNTHDLLTESCDYISRLSESYTYTGAAHYNDDGSITGTISQIGKSATASTAGPTCDTPSVTFATKSSTNAAFTGSSSDLVWQPSNYYTKTKTATIAQILGTGSCVSNSPHDNTYGAYSGSITITLSDQDTAEAAFSRCLANLPDWTAWTLVAHSATIFTYRLARYQSSAGTDIWGYQECEWEIDKTGLLPSHTYTISINMMRSIFAANSYSLYSTVTVTGTTDGSGHLVVSGTVPNDEGFDTYADDSGIVITP